MDLQVGDLVDYRERCTQTLSMDWGFQVGKPRCGFILRGRVQPEDSKSGTRARPVVSDT